MSDEIKAIREELKALRGRVERLERELLPTIWEIPPHLKDEIDKLKEDSEHQNAIRTDDK